MDQANDLGVSSLDLCGFGDSFLDPELEKKLSYVKARYPHIKIYTSTTAHALGKKNREIASRYLDTIRISNYGFSKESYEAIHGGVLRFDRVMKNIHDLLRSNVGERPYVMMTFLLMEQNRGEEKAWQQYWEPLVEEIAVWEAHNYAGAESVEEFAYVAREFGDRKEIRSCGRPFRGNPFVRTNGDVSVCCFDFNHKLVVGNVNSEPLAEVLLGEKLARVKQIHKKKIFEGCGLLCEGCDQLFSRQDALLYSSNPSRRTDQPNNHPDHLTPLIGD